MRSSSNLAATCQSYSDKMPSEERYSVWVLSCTSFISFFRFEIARSGFCVVKSEIVYAFLLVPIYRSLRTLIISSSFSSDVFSTGRIPRAVKYSFAEMPLTLFTKASIEDNLRSLFSCLIWATFSGSSSFPLYLSSKAFSIATSLSSSETPLLL